MSKETDEILGHADENDGIEEYDNPLPDWWLGLFFFCIVWAIGYTIDYHFIAHDSQAKAYDREMADAAVRWPQKEIVVDLSPATVEEGHQIFVQNCTGCHGEDMKGKIGPNLLDGTWIHGGSLEEITHTITNGVPSKGMVTWGPILGPERIAKVAAFVYMSGPQLGLTASAATAPNDPTRPGGN